jgi:hypothetical protein
MFPIWIYSSMGGPLKPSFGLSGEIRIKHAAKILLKVIRERTIPLPQDDNFGGVV